MKPDPQYYYGKREYNGKSMMMMMMMMTMVLGFLSFSIFSYMHGCLYTKYISWCRGSIWWWNECTYLKAVQLVTEGYCMKPRECNNFAQLTPISTISFKSQVKILSSQKKKKSVSSITKAQDISWYSICCVY